MGKARIGAVQEHEFGVCVWEIEDDTSKYLSDDEQNYLSLEGKLGDLEVEKKMRKAAEHYLGDKVNEGRPVWLPGYRKISDMEHDDQMARFLEGKIPDEVDVVRQILNKKN
jgi:phage portal protein BeeE